MTDGKQDMANGPGNASAPPDSVARSAIDEAVEQFEAAWHAAGQANLSNFLPPPEDTSRERVLVELIKVDQEFRWAQGDSRLLEAYLADWPELDGKQTLARELLEAECLTRAAFEALPVADELQSRFPAIAGQIELDAVDAQLVWEKGQGKPRGSAMVDTSKMELDQTFPFGPKTAPLKVGKSFGENGRYEIKELLGQGGMGTVYRAHDSRLAIDVALKIPRLDPSTEQAVRERFVREARAAAKIRHPNICRIFDAGQSEGTFYISMDLIEGQSLADWQTQRDVEPQQAVQIVAKLARALAAVHAEGIVHRDIKPSNVMIDRQGEPLLMDFGLARLESESAVEDLPATPSQNNSPTTASTDGVSASAAGILDQGRLTHTGLLLGTLQYMSPEQTLGQSVDATADVYSLGVLFYQLLTGRLPFEGTPAEILEGIRHAPPPSPSSLRPDLDPALEAICLKALEKEPGDRYGSAQTMAAQLLQHRNERTASANIRPRRGRLIWMGVAFGAVMILLAVLIILKTGNGTLVLEVEPTDATVTIDGNTVTLTSGKVTSTVPVGQSRLVVSRQGYEQVRETLDIRWRGDTSTQQVEMKEIPSFGATRRVPITGLATGLAFGPHNDHVYACVSRFPDTRQIQKIDLTTGQATTLIEAPDDKHDYKGFTLSENARYVYVSNYFLPSISRFDLKHGGFQENLPVGGVPNKVWATWVGLTPDQNKLVVCIGNDGGNTDMKNDQLSVVDVAHGDFTLAGQIRLKDEYATGGVAFSDDSKRAYFVTLQRQSDAPKLYEVALEEPWRVVRSLAFPGTSDRGLKGIAVSNRLQRIWVSDATHNCIWIVDLTTFQRIGSLALDGRAPGCLLLNQDESLLAVLRPETQTILFVDPANGRTLAIVNNVSQRGVAPAAFSHDGTSMVVACDKPEPGIAVIPLSRIWGAVVFASDRAGEEHELYRMDINGQHVTRLTDNLVADWGPRWSPDGRRIAYVSGQPGGARICVMNHDGTRVRVLENSSPIAKSDYQGVTIDWSPDGREIVFIDNDYSTIQIVDVVSDKTRTVHQGPLAKGCSFHTGLCWRKSDGAILIASQHPRNVNLQHLFALDAKTGEWEQLTSENSLDGIVYLAPAASPDGQRMAVVRSTEALSDGPNALLSLDSHAENPVQIAATKVGAIRSPRWTSEGNHLVYSAAVGHFQHVFLAPASGKAAIQLTSGESDNVDPDVSTRVNASQAGP